MRQYREDISWLTRLSKLTSASLAAFALTLAPLAFLSLAMSPPLPMRIPAWLAAPARTPALPAPSPRSLRTNAIAQTRIYAQSSPHQSRCGELFHIHIFMAYRKPEQTQSDKEAKATRGPTRPNSSLHTRSYNRSIIQKIKYKTRRTVNQEPYETCESFPAPGPGAQAKRGARAARAGPRPRQEVESRPPVSGALLSHGLPPQYHRRGAA